MFIRPEPRTRGAVFRLGVGGSRRTNMKTAVARCFSILVLLNDAPVLEVATAYPCVVLADSPQVLAGMTLAPYPPFVHCDTTPESSP